MSYFDEWLDDYFEPTIAETIRGIGCTSYGASKQKSQDEIVRQLAAAGISQKTIGCFLSGIRDYDLFTDIEDPIQITDLIHRLEQARAHGYTHVKITHEPYGHNLKTVLIAQSKLEQPCNEETSSKSSA